MKELSLINCRLDKRYDIHEQLGRGSYAEIYLARDIIASPQSPHSTVVLKALNVALQDDLDEDLERTLVENFQNEAVALDRVRHPNIISRLGHGTARDLRGTVFHYLVLEYLPGGDLQRLMRKKKLSLPEAMKYIEQICAGLSHAHSCGVIHRDIKPQNLLLTADHSTVKIADFGVARVDLGDRPITRVGTNIYAPPEHSPLNIGKTGELGGPKLTAAADIYSLAKSIYSILCGEPPRGFANAAITSLPESVRGEEWADDLLPVLQRATMHDASERQQTIDELWADLLPIREKAAEGEYSTVWAASGSLQPQPHVSRGYTPLAPEKPVFETNPDDQPIVNIPPSEKLPPLASIDQRPDAVVNETPLTTAAYVAPRSGIGRRAITFAIAIVIFTGLLYGTASYMKGRGFLPQVGSFFSGRTAVATTDIYLRPGPAADGEPVGLVTKNSKVRIVNSRDNWYQVDVIEQGRSRPQAPSTTRGWLNGKYLDFSDN